MKQNFHIGIMGNLFSGKTTLMRALARDPYKRDLETLLDGAEIHAFSERVDKGSLIDECLALFYRDRVANIFPTELAFLHMRTLQQREIRHLMTRESARGVIIVEDRPFVDGPEVFVKRMIESGEMPAAHAKLYRTLFHQTLRNEHIRLPDLTVYLRTEPEVLERRRAKRAAEGDDYAATISLEIPARDPRQLRIGRRELEAHAARLPGTRHRAARRGPDHAARGDRHAGASRLRARRCRHDSREGPPHDRGAAQRPLGAVSQPAYGG